VGASASSAYSFSALLNEQPVSLSKYAGRVVVVVNIASA
jgi:glutathione peroxidase-family protein